MSPEERLEWRRNIRQVLDRKPDVEEVKEVQMKSFISLIEFLYFYSCCYLAKVIMLYVMVGGELVFAQH